jgi:8-oxo-dGTP pyrophosphatase MutT (NUDIX family)
MNFSAFIELLKNKMQKPLPGSDAQEKMAPKVRFNEKPEGIIPQNAGVLILLYPKNEEAGIVFMKRPENTGVHSGQISLPGGKQEKTDHDIVHTALRETSEEIGASKDDIEIIGSLSTLYIKPSNFMVHPFVGYLTYKPFFVIDPNEVDYLIETPVELFLDPAIKKKKTIQKQAFSISAPIFDVEGEHIWGATAMIISELIECIK